jgi:hypothetical protein
MKRTASYLDENVTEELASITSTTGRNFFPIMNDENVENDENEGEFDEDDMPALENDYDDMPALINDNENENDYDDMPALINDNENENDYDDMPALINDDDDDDMPPALIPYCRRCSYMITDSNSIRNN